MSSPSRNDPCTCGSGKKYKNCCRRKLQARGPWRSRLLGWGLLVVVAVAVVLVVDTVRRAEPVVADPYRYDAANDRYWDPDHGHWHDGPPPDGVGELDETGPTPEAWTYDQQRDRHWDPGHGHWHEGPPPIDRIGVPAQESVP